MGFAEFDDVIGRLGQDRTRRQHRCRAKGEHLFHGAPFIQSSETMNYGYAFRPDTLILVPVEELLFLGRIVTRTVCSPPPISSVDQRKGTSR